MMRLNDVILIGIAVGFSTFNLEAFDNELFSAKIKEPAPQWMLDQIHHDLAPFSQELSRENIEKLFLQDIYLPVRVEVINGVMIIEQGKTVMSQGGTDPLINHLMRLSTLVELPDIDFVFTAIDQIGHFPPNESLLPLFIISKYKDAPDQILIPDWFSLAGFEPEKSEVHLGNHYYPWESKIPSLFFRGADSGVYDKSKWESYPRAKLVALSIQYPHLIDARFYNVSNREYYNLAIEKGYLGAFVSMVHAPRYRYVMDIDGNCAATPRFPLLLHTTSVVFKNTTQSMLWFYGRVEPYKHFIPVAEDLSDLLPQLQWAKTHEAECRMISDNARQLAAEIFTQEEVYRYLYHLLVEYAKKQALYYEM